MMFSFKRLYALLRKEWAQLTRDALTLRFIIAIPIAIQQIATTEIIFP